MDLVSEQRGFQQDQPDCPVCQCGSCVRTASAINADLFCLSVWISCQNDTWPGCPNAASSGSAVSCRNKHGLKLDCPYGLRLLTVLVTVGKSLRWWVSCLVG